MLKKFDENEGFKIDCIRTIFTEGIHYKKMDPTIGNNGD